MTKIWLGAALSLVAAAPATADVVADAKAAGATGGVVVHLGCGDGTQTAALRLDERFLVHGLDADPANVAKARAHIRSKRLYGPVSVDVFDGARLPYVDNTVNVLVADALGRVPMDEVTRVLAPRGVAMIGGKKTVKPWPEAIDEWTHFLHGPDNNAVANDSVVAKPRSFQWVSGPRWGRSHEEMASMSAAVSAKGRMFYIVDEAPLAYIRFDGIWKLVARDAFNGTLLWKRDIPQWSDHLRHFRAGPLHLPRRLVAVGDRVYATLGIDAPVSVLDAATGKTVKTLPGTERTEEIVVSDGVAYLAVGTSEVQRKGGGLHERGEPKPSGFRFITAIQAETGRALWKHTCPDGGFLLPLTLTVNGSGVFYQSTAGVVRLDAGSGKVLWKTKRLTPLKRMSFSGPTVVATDSVLLCADRDATEQDAAKDKLEWGVHGWNESGFARKGKTTLRAYDVKTGKELWSVPCSEGYNSPVDLFVIDGVVWAGTDFKGYDVKTGALKTTLQWKGPGVGMPHHRCYRNKATENYIYTGRSGIEVVSLEKGNVGNNSWIRGTCQYGIIPCNGLLYAPPNACACFSKVKLVGFFAAAHHRGDGRMRFDKAPALVKGPAYGKAAGDAPGAEDWPMYRHNATRGGVASTTLPASLRRTWSAAIGGRITQAVAACGKVYVAATDTHTVHALDAGDGKEAWSFTAGGRIDSAPTVYKGLVLFGCADGRIYALRATDGQLAWRFRAAPLDRRGGAYGQLESVWPVHGAVLVQNDVLYASAGRNSYIDGGMVLYTLDPLTGEEKSRESIYDLNPETDIQKAGERGFNMEGVTSDVLSGDGESVYIKHVGFDKNGKTMSGTTQPHLFAAVGILGEEWFVRSYWLLGTQVGTGWGGWANIASQVPAGRILCFDGEKVYGYGRVTVASAATGHKADAYHLFCKEQKATAAAPTPKAPAPDAAKKKKKGRKPKGGPAPKLLWADTESLTVRAMVLAADRVVVAGPPNVGKRDPQVLQFTNESEALAAFRGEKGVFLRVVSAADGKKLSEQKLPDMPVFDGISAANGCLFISFKNGTLECWGK